MCKQGYSHYGKYMVDMTPTVLLSVSHMLGTWFGGVGGSPETITWSNDPIRASETLPGL